MTQLTFILAFICSGDLIAQTVLKADAKKWTAYYSKATFNDGIIHLTRAGDKSGLLWLNNADFKNGTIELDIKGKDADGQSFVGIAFHGSDNTHYDAVYFRPFNFRNPERKGRSVQYVDLPDNDWHVLRERHPGKYESELNPAPDPNDWFHAKIVIQFPEIKVYINNSKEPSLVVEQLSKRADGKFGMWIDGEEGWFKNVVLTQRI